jgi:hypothetical protein
MSGIPITPHDDPDWFIVEEGFDLAREHEVESILTICNGYLGIRASKEGQSLSRPSTFVAGIYVTDEDLGPRLAVFPAWLHVEVSVEDQLLSFGAGRVLEHRRFLDLRQGVLWRNWRQRDPSGRITRLTYLHIASLADRHVVVQSIAATAENYMGSISLVACPIDRLGLTGKPAPDMFLEAARRLSVPPARAVVFEDATAGVAAARAGGFGLAIGVGRNAQAAALRDSGADRVVASLDEICWQGCRKAPV